MLIPTLYNSQCNTELSKVDRCSNRIHQTSWDPSVNEELIRQQTPPFVKPNFHLLFICLFFVMCFYILQKAFSVPPLNFLFQPSYPSSSTFLIGKKSQTTVIIFHCILKHLPLYNRIFRSWVPEVGPCQLWTMWIVSYAERHLFAETVMFLNYCVLCEQTNAKREKVAPQIFRW